MAEESSEVRQRSGVGWVIGACLFMATAAVVVWQNSRLGVLWDLSYILENSFRISAGDIPYKDFPFPYAPLTFLTQAAIIKLTGRVFWHHIAYCAIVGGIGAVISWRILLNVFGDRVARPEFISLMLTLPLVILGIYCVYPHPFYDPDCTFVILLCIFLLQRLERGGFPPIPSFLTGALLVVPLFVKQNTGLGFLGSVGFALAVLFVIEAWRKRPSRGYLLLICGIVASLAVALTVIHFTAGLENYQHWTIRFAAERRTPSGNEMYSIYLDKLALGWTAVFALGAGLFWVNRRGRRWLAALAICMMSVPFLWPVIYLLLDDDASERAERLLGIWPLVLIVSLILAILSARRRTGIDLALPFVLIGTVNGAFLSQQVWGSTYALWPLLFILVGYTIRALVEIAPEQSGDAVMPLAVAIAATLLVAGAFYIRSHERLDYADLTEGDLVRSSLPPLKGLSVRGSWLPDFEELVQYTDKEIPRDEGILMLPGEDLFYYTTGRRPRFPVLMFDHTVNPLSAEEIVEQARERGIQWLIIKDGTQLEEEPLESLGKDHLIQLLRQDFKQVESLNNYDIYKRRAPGDVEDNQDDQDDNNDSDDSDDSDDR